ncbi:hypothetical protein [Pontibacter sp. G13]|uniref:hypothetical protein n=1 Tax=Pontibacter sp. G13 TaxID=3074898 RepID=UPI00288A1901|nr:hypothetical protein [Pontibacter sp. G13]WNJ17930.1 hypothetical protein RJD25_24005 [Pontibacter sp. G13]
MKNLFVKNATFLLAVMTLLLGSSACNDNGNIAEPSIDPPLVALNYDSDNQDSPELPGATYEGAVKFPEEIMSTYEDNLLEGVYIFTQDLPQTATIKVYKGTLAGAPRELLYSQVITDELSRNSWNFHRLNRTIELDGSDLWLAFKFSHSDNLRVLGCDPGPAVADGDYLFDSSDSQWIKLSSRTANEININWNIRGVISP